MRPRPRITRHYGVSRIDPPEEASLASAAVRARGRGLAVGVMVWWSAFVPSAFAQAGSAGAQESLASDPVAPPAAPTGAIDPPAAAPTNAETTPLASGSKCAAHAECGGELLCIGHRCVAPASAVAPPPTPQAGRPPTPVPAPSPAPTEEASAPGAPSGPTGATFDDTHVFIGVERLFGIATWSNTRTVTANGKSEETSVSGSSLSLLWGTTSPDSVPAMAFALPRLGVDVRIGRYFMFGGSAAYFGTSSEEKSKSSSKENPSLYMVAVAPRLGVSLPLAPRLILLLRGGVTIYDYEESEKSSKGGTNVTASSGVALSLDASAAYMIVPHAAFTLGFAFDRGLTGSVTEDPAGANPPNVSLIPMNVGLTAGMLVAF